MSRNGVNFAEFYSQHRTPEIQTIAAAPHLTMSKLKNVIHHSAPRITYEFEAQAHHEKPLKRGAAQH